MREELAVRLFPSRPVSKESSLHPHHLRQPDNTRSPSWLYSRLQAHLLDLPAELRNTIYRLTLTTNDAITINSNASPQRWALLRTCKTIRDEATPIFYSENTFHLPLDGEQNAASIAWLEVFSDVLKHINKLVLRPGLSEAYWSTTLAPLVANLHFFALKPLEEKISADQDIITDSLDRAYAAGLPLKGMRVRPLARLEVTAHEYHTKAYRDRIYQEVFFWLHDKRRHEMQQWHWKETAEKARNDPEWVRPMALAFPESDDLEDSDSE